MQPAADAPAKRPVAQPAGRKDADRAHAVDQTADLAGLLQRESVVAAQERGHEHAQRVHVEVVQRPGDDDPPHRRQAEHAAKHRGQRQVDGGRRLLFFPVHRPPSTVHLSGVGDEERGHGQGEARHSRDEEGVLPAVVLRDGGADDEAEGQPQRQADHEQAQRPRPPLGRHQVADQRVGRRRAAGLADAHPQPHHEQRPEAPRQPGAERQQAPQSHAQGQDPLAPPHVGQAAQGQPDQGVEQDERGAEPAQLRVGQLPLVLDLLLDRGQDLAVEEVHGVDGE